LKIGQNKRLRIIFQNGIQKADIILALKTEIPSFAVPKTLGRKEF
jgi:hypothetical protein